MMKVFIDGSAGTAGLRIRSRLEGRADLDVTVLEGEARKDTEKRREMLNSCDLAVLCLPPLQLVFGTVPMTAGQWLWVLALAVAPVLACEGAKALGRARAGLAAGLAPDAVLIDVEEAMEAMGELTGRTVREDITNRIFERFCVGK